MTTMVAIDPLLTIREVERITSLERSTIYRRQQHGRFPDHQYVANRRVWRASVITAWLDAELTTGKLTRVIGGPRAA